MLRPNIRIHIHIKIHMKQYKNICSYQKCVTKFVTHFWYVIQMNIGIYLCQIFYTNEHLNIFVMNNLALQFFSFKIIIIIVFKKFDQWISISDDRWCVKGIKEKVATLNKDIIGFNFDLLKKSQYNFAQCNVFYFKENGMLMLMLKLYDN